MSEMRTIQVEFGNLQALSRAIEALGGKVLGEGNHSIWGKRRLGFGFTLSRARLPIVLKADGSLVYDDMVSDDVEMLGHEYVRQVAEEVAAGLGYYAERVSGAVKVYFPNAAEVWILDDGRVDARGFGGIGCDEACEQFSRALGRTVKLEHKAEYYEERARVVQPGE
jgi:hypothetical protein